jgi:large subunit ribosomal protein L10
VPNFPLNFFTKRFAFSSTALLQVRSQCLQFKRFRGKINIQRPRKPHYIRQRVIEVTNPTYTKESLDKRCLEKFEQIRIGEQENPYEKIIAKEVQNWFKHSQMVAVFHVNSINAEDEFKAKLGLHKHNMQLKTYGRKIMRRACEDTVYENLLPLFDSKYYIVFSPEVKIRQLMSVVKKVPQMHLLAAVLENRIMSKTELMAFAALPDLETARGQLVNVLNSAGSKIVSDLQCHQSNLTNILDAYVRENQKEQAKPVVEEGKSTEPSS